MFKKLRILLICSMLESSNTLIFNLCMHNSYARFSNFLEICKEFGTSFVNDQGNYAKETVGFFTRIIGEISDFQSFNILTSKTINLLGKLNMH